MKKLNTILKICVFILFAAVVVSGCKKAEDPLAIYTPEREAGLIKDWLAYMVSTNKDIDTTSTGIYYVVDKVGTGTTVQAGDSVTVKYTGMFMDGQIFDASAYHGNGTYKYVHKDADPYKRLIQGWEEGIEVLQKGGSAAFLIPSSKGYGITGSYDGSIPPYSPLIFVIEVVDIKRSSL